MQGEGEKKGQKVGAGAKGNQEDVAEVAQAGQGPGIGDEAGTRRSARRARSRVRQSQAADCMARQGR